MTVDQVAFAVSDSCLRLGQYGEAIRALEDRIPATGGPQLPKPVLASARSLCLVTSLMPSRLAIQKRAVKSWLELGAQVISLNAAHERTILEGTFPDVQFVTAPRHAEGRFGKPYVYVHDMMTVLADAPTRTVGLINADIVLSPKAGPLLDKALAETRATLVCGHRYNVDTIDRADAPDSGAQIYEGGYDWFLFSPESAIVYMDAPFIFGGPWWDIWLPACALSSKITVSMVRDSVAFHEYHEQRWDETMYRELGQDFIRTMTATSRQGEGRFNMRLSELLGTAHALFENDKPSAQKFSWLSPLLRSLIALDSCVL